MPDRKGRDHGHRSGPDEIKVAYEHFFEGFDKGEQKFE